MSHTARDNGKRAQWRSEADEGHRERRKRSVEKGDGPRCTALLQTAIACRPRLSAAPFGRQQGRLVLIGPQLPLETMVYWFR